MGDPFMGKWDRGNPRKRAYVFLAQVCLVTILICTACSEELIQDPPPASVPDTTSHDFVWTPIIIDELDAHGVLHDICYINDTCIWAVGWIGAGPDYYNALRWNGKKWVFEQVPDSIPEATGPEVHELFAVYGNRPESVWFSHGTRFVHWDGNRFSTDLSTVDQMKGSLTESWASGPTNIWMGGWNGELVHYNGMKWKRIPNDIPNEWGITGMHGHADTLVLAATQYGTTGQTAFYKVIGESVTFWRQDSLPQGVHAVWFEHTNNLWTDGSKTFQWDGFRWLDRHSPYAGYGWDMSANNRNDILICGDICTIRHWNGRNWRSWWKFPGLETARFWALDYRGDHAWIAGEVGFPGQGLRPLILHGER
ncbi:MAG: hypothetical protein IH600_15370 [Bacteroidetes bacterium]|nr:hypothetical protein [Bacteroidota bacterium]